MTTASANFVSSFTNLSFESGIIATSNNLYVPTTTGISLFDTNGVIINASFITTSDANFGGVFSMAINANTLYAVITPIPLSPLNPIPLSSLNSIPQSSSKISVYNATTGELIQDSLISGLNGYKYIAVSDNGNIYLSDMVNGISVYDGASLLEINDNFITGLDEPGGIAIGGDYLYVANFGGSTIGLYNATTGATINANFISGLNVPNAIVISDDGNYLYVVNGSSSTVGMYNTSDGSAVNNNLVGGLNYPRGIAISGSSLYIYSYFYEENSNAYNYGIGIYDVNIYLPSIRANYSVKFYGINGEVIDEKITHTLTGNATGSGDTQLDAFEEVNKTVTNDIHTYVSNNLEPATTFLIPTKTVIEIDYTFLSS